MSAGTEQKNAAPVLKRIASPPEWEALLLPVDAFPIPDVKQIFASESLINAIVTAATGQWRLSLESFVQVEQSDAKECRAILAKYAPEWIPDVGLGIWPDREPPAAHTQDEFLKLQLGQKFRKLTYPVLRITETPKAKSEATRLMVPFGPLLVILTADIDTFLEKASAVLLAPIQDPSFTSYPFNVPLLEAKSIASATGAQLEAWMCGAEVYIRQSFEDKGMLILSRRVLTPMLKQFGWLVEERTETVV